MTESPAAFKRRLMQTGLSESAISAAWPEWWSEAADASPSAQAELRFSVARKLGLDPRSLLEEGRPRFIWDDSVRYKNFRGAPSDRAAVASFGTAFAHVLLAATPSSDTSLVGMPANALRGALLARGRPFIELRDLMALLWGLGSPVVHLRVYPLAAKRMCAMSAMVQNRCAILLARDATYPAPVAFHLAHEIAHVALGHVKAGSAVVDMIDPTEDTDVGPSEHEAPAVDPEESDADSYALELLTGSPKPEIVVQGPGHSARELARQARSVGAKHQIEPGTLALCAGFVTGDWKLAHAALRHIYAKAQAVWEQINGFALRELRLDLLPEDSADYVRAVLGSPP